MRATGSGPPAGSAPLGGGRIPALLTAVPALVALGLGLIYGAGAVRKMGQISAVHVNISDALPLVPLPQILTLGIEVAVDAAAVAPAVILFSFLAHQIGPGVGKRLRSNVAARSMSDAPLKGMLTLGVGLGLLILMLALAPPVIVVTQLIGGIVLQRVWGRPWAFATAAFCLTLAAFSLETYLYPAPLPRVAIATVDRHRIVGRLVVVTDEGWWLADGSRAIRLVPRAQIAAATTLSEHTRGPRSTLASLGL